MFPKHHDRQLPVFLWCQVCSMTLSILLERDLTFPLRMDSRAGLQDPFRADAGCKQWDTVAMLHNLTGEELNKWEKCCRQSIHGLLYCCCCHYLAKNSILTMQDGAEQCHIIPYCISVSLFIWWGVWMMRLHWAVLPQNRCKFPDQTTDLKASLVSFYIVSN